MFQEERVSLSEIFVCSGFVSTKLHTAEIFENPRETNLMSGIGFFFITLKSFKKLGKHL